MIKISQFMGLKYIYQSAVVLPCPLIVNVSFCSLGSPSNNLPSPAHPPSVSGQPHEEVGVAGLTAMSNTVTAPPASSTKRSSGGKEGGGGGGGGRVKREGGRRRWEEGGGRRRREEREEGEGEEGG